jgi:isoprenylcysteine carboxyl methyltransferase (ICMT) family protein YpbQ
LQFSIHDGFYAIHIFSRFWALKLLVAEERELVEDLPWPRAMFLVLELTDSWF